MTEATTGKDRDSLEEDSVRVGWGLEKKRKNNEELSRDEGGETTSVSLICGEILSEERGGSVEREAYR